MSSVRAKIKGQNSWLCPDKPHDSGKFLNLLEHRLLCEMDTDRIAGTGALGSKSVNTRKTTQNSNSHRKQPRNVRLNNNNHC